MGDDVRWWYLYIVGMADVNGMILELLKYVFSVELYEISLPLETRSKSGTLGVMPNFSEWDFWDFKITFWLSSEIKWK